VPRPRFRRLDPDKRESVLSAAASEFVQHGYHKASLNRVQKALGLSKGAFYYWFDDKEDLFGAVLRREADALAVEVGGLMAGPPDDSPLWDQVARGITDLMAYIARSPDFLALLKAALVLQPAEDSPVRAMLEESVALTEALVVEGQRRGDVRTDLPAALLAHVAHGMLEGLDRYALQQASFGDTPPEVAAELYVSMLQRVLLPER